MTTSGPGLTSIKSTSKTSVPFWFSSFKNSSLDLEHQDPETSSVSTVLPGSWLALHVSEGSPYVVEADEIQSRHSLYNIQYMWYRRSFISLGPCFEYNKHVNLSRC